MCLCLGMESAAENHFDKKNFRLPLPQEKQQFCGTILLLQPCRSRKNQNLNTLLTLLNFSNRKMLAGSARLFRSPERKAAWAGLLQPCAWGPDLSRLDFPAFMGEFYNRSRCSWQYPPFSLLWSTQEGMRRQLDLGFEMTLLPLLHKPRTLII